MRKRIDLALADDVAIPLDAQASRHELVAGENFSVDVSIAGIPAVPVKWTLEREQHFGAEWMERDAGRSEGSE